ncbi:MAG: hypothetical protein ABR598_06395 [Candidatus Dormibacteria bacterium]
MSAPDALVEVDPASIRAVIESMRASAVEYVRVASAISANLPPMPPLFHLVMEQQLERIRRRLHNLAFQLEVDALREAWRVAALEEAGATGVLRPMAALADDLGNEVRQVIQGLQAEPGPQASIDPDAARVHLASGVADNALQVWNEAAMVGRLGPNYDQVDPAGAAEARQQALATFLNLCELGGTWDAVDPGIRTRALQHALGRALDVKDLAAGDIPRWVGHVGSGLALGRIIVELAGGPGRVPPAVKLEDNLTTGALVTTGYDNISRVNRIPSDRDEGDEGVPSRARMVVNLERRLITSLGPAKPPRRRAR